MTFASIAASNTTADTSSGSVTVNMPSGIAAGNLLIVFCAQDAVGTITQSGGSDWTKIEQNPNGTECSQAIFAKIAAGGDTLTLASTNSQDFSCVSVRITGHGILNVSTDIVKGTAATGSDAAPNPPNCNPGTSNDFLWIEMFAADDDDDTTNYESANYTKVAQIQSASSASSCLCAVAYRQLTASAENPGVMAMAATEGWVAQTIAIRPEQTFTKTFTIDTILKKADILKTYTIDSVLKKTDILKTFTIDSILVKRFTKEFTADSILKKIDILKTFTTDSVLQKLGVLKTFTVDTILKKTSILKTFTTDTILKKANIEKTFTSDSILKKTNITKTFTIDSVLLKQIINSFTIDSILKKTGLSKTFTVDVVLIEEGGEPEPEGGLTYTGTHPRSMLFRGPSYCDQEWKISLSGTTLLRMSCMTNFTANILKPHKINTKFKAITLRPANANLKLKSNLLKEQKHKTELKANLTIKQENILNIKSRLKKTRLKKLFLEKLLRGLKEDE